MKDDLLLPGWRERIASAPVAGPALPLPPPLARDYLAGRVHFVRDSGGARAGPGRVRIAGDLRRHRHRIPF